jgi:hypothetical protein
MRNAQRIAPSVVLFAGCLAAVLAHSSPVQARPAHKRALVDYFGPFLSKKLNDCRT